MKRRITIIGVLTIIMMLFGSLTCFAATGETCTNVKGSTAATKTFKIKVTPKTYGSDFITLKHYKKGKYQYEYKLFGYWTGNFKSKNAYGYYKVTLKDSNGKTVKTINWKNQKDLKIKLSNWFKYKGEHFSTKVYRVTVAPYNKSNMRINAHYGFTRWIAHNKWEVYKTRGVATCW